MCGALRTVGALYHPHCLAAGPSSWGGPLPRAQRRDPKQEKGPVQCDSTGLSCFPDPRVGAPIRVYSQGTCFGKKIGVCGWLFLVGCFGREKFGEKEEQVPQSGVWRRGIGSGSYCSVTRRIQSPERLADNSGWVNRPQSAQT